VEVAVECRVAEALVAPPTTVPADPVAARRTLAAGETWAHAWSVALPLDRTATDEGAAWSIAVRWVVGMREAAASYPLRVLSRSTPGGLARSSTW